MVLAPLAATTARVAVGSRAIRNVAKCRPDASLEVAADRMQGDGKALPPACKIFGYFNSSLASVRVFAGDDAAGKVFFQTAAFAHDALRAGKFQQADATPARADAQPPPR